MKPEELKAFIEGIEHGFQDGRPTAEQWEKIKEKIGKLEAGEVKPVRWPEWPSAPSPSPLGPYIGDKPGVIDCGGTVPIRERLEVRQ